MYYLPMGKILSLLIYTNAHVWQTSPRRGHAMDWIRYSSHGGNTGINILYAIFMLLFLLLLRGVVVPLLPLAICPLLASDRNKLIEHTQRGYLFTTNGCREDGIEIRIPRSRGRANQWISEE